MNKKVTRRAVLGTIITGLVVAPFVMRSMRTRNTNERIGAVTFDSLYGKIDVPLEKIDSHLSIEERGKALEILEKERRRWLAFRGVEGDVRIKKTSMSSGQGTVEEGRVRLQFDLKVGPKSRFGEYVTHDLQMFFSKSKESSPLWAIQWKGPLGNKPEISGSDKERMTSAGLGEAFQLLLCPIMTFAALSNEAFAQMMPIMQLTDDSKERGSDSYTFAPNGDLAEDGVLVPTLKFTQGHLSSYIPKRTPNTFYIEILLTAAEQFDDFLFPKVFEWKPVANGNALPDESEVCSLEFVNPRVFTK